MTLFNPGKQSEYCTQLDKCFTGSAPSLYRIKIAYGNNAAESWLEIQIRDLSEFTGCKGKMSVAQIEETSRIIVNNYGYLKITELMYFFQLFKAGRFGRFYGAVDGLIITTSLLEFLKIRASELDRLEKAKKEHIYKKSRKLCLKLIII